MISAHSQYDDNTFKEKHENNPEKKDRAMSLPRCRCLISDILTTRLEVGEKHWKLRMQQ